MNNNEANLCKSFAERHGLDREPMVNVLNQEEFQNRVRKVFKVIADTIGKSLGPGGKTTFISNYPYLHPTKDGYTIMKNLSMQLQLDQIIMDMADTVCSRLNYTVGDGTTSAIMATNAVYDAVQEKLDRFDYYKSREVSQAFDIIRDEIISRLRESAVDIRSDDEDELARSVIKIASIASNDDVEIVRIITNLYRQLMYPAITVSLSKSGETKGKIVVGYPAEVLLTDQLYINNDNNTMSLSNSDVLIFDHKVTESTYQTIINPLNYQCKVRGRHLIVIAPFYDETALTGPIRRDILAEYNKEKDVNLVLTVCRKISANHRVMLSDLAMLLNTDVISMGMEDEIKRGLMSMDQTNGILYYINIDDRGIKGLSVLGVDTENKTLHVMRDGDDNPYPKWDYSIDANGNPTGIKRLNLGFAGQCELGLEQSIFTELNYNEDLYQKTIREAKQDLEDCINKYKKLGSFTTEIGERKKRLFRLGMKMGIIEVGGESEISQKYIKDAIDDTVRAVESAYNHGVVAGSHVTMINIINDMIDEARNCNYDMEGMGTVEELQQRDKLIIMLLESLKTGFTIVFKSVLNNAGITDDDADNIIKESLKLGTTYNVGTREYDGNVINSCETDVEILRAVIDLIGLISTSNQLVICEQRMGTD